MPEAQLAGLIGREAVRIVSAQMMGESCDLVYRDMHCNLRTEILLLGKEVDLTGLVNNGKKRRIQGDCYKIPLIPEGAIKYGYQWVLHCGQQRRRLLEAVLDQAQSPMLAAS